MGTTWLEGAWIAVHVRANHERKVKALLELCGYQGFLPTYRPSRGASPTSQERPLFAGYVFCRYLHRALRRIVDLPGVVRLVGDGRVPAVIPDFEIEAIQRIDRLGIHSEPWRFMAIGQRVRLTAGPLMGIEGTLVARRKDTRLIVSISLLQRSVVVDVAGASVEPLLAR